MASSSSLPRTSSSEFYEAGLIYYLELYKAVLNGDWESASRLLTDDPQSLSAPIGTDDSPVLHIAVELGEASMGFVEKLVEFMPREALDLQDSDGATALFNAVRAGNIKAAKLLVNKKSDLPNICNGNGFAPLHTAVKYGHKELTKYLLDVTRDDVDPSPFADMPGIELLRRALMVGFHVLAKRPWAFPSGSRFNLWQLIIYHSAMYTASFSLTSVASSSYSIQKSSSSKLLF